jgi:hypothetical protein
MKKESSSILSTFLALALLTLAAFTVVSAVESSQINLKSKVNQKTMFGDSNITGIANEFINEHLKNER